MRIGLQKAKARIVQNSSELYFFIKNKETESHCVQDCINLNTRIYKNEH